MTVPASGATGVPTTIGSITVPALPEVAGSTLSLIAGNVTITGGTFVASAGSATASVPRLAPNTTYYAQTFAPPPCSTNASLFYGSFTTGSS